ncbi:MAG: cytochrome b/b6 domain-containing protein [Candidatus Omnitrophica bacterium]|nr:cytochrome b/b6 domain-containing protein [Candidatus Omnitrophota bacterium]
MPFGGNRVKLDLVLILIALAICLWAALACAEEPAPAPLDEPAAAETIANEDCLACHDTFKLEDFETTAHGSNLCTSCHSDIKELPHPESLKQVDCAVCHRVEAEIYGASDHGKALKSGVPAASCLNCHGDTHTIRSARDPLSPIHRLNIPQTCAVCHENEKMMARYSLLEKQPLHSYADTVHGKALLEKKNLSAAVCNDCHGSHDLHAPTNPESKIFKKHVPGTCGKCHENVLRTYERSIHGRAALAGKMEVPVCTDCHGEHNILSHKDPASTVYTTAVSEKTCGHCHAAEKVVTKYRLPADRVKTYLESYHGLASKFGRTTVANCASCHGAHDILPSSDPASSVNKKNLPQTCGRCHPNVSDQLAKGSIHIAPSSLRDQVVYFVGVFYVWLILLVIGGMIVHNALDFARKLREHYARAKQKGRHTRFTLSERIQHLLLAVSFILLAYSGFALKYPDAWWAAPFTFFGTQADWRGIVHRLAAKLFMAVGAFHLGYLAFTKRGRGQFRALLPAAKDFSDFWRMQKHNLGLTPEKPVLARYNYVEKLEYWALVWGSVVMAVTGLMLVYENFAMRYFPKWALDVATIVHFYEAVLATLAIVIWHFYFAMFDPENYPMNWSMFTGKSPEGHGENGN